jgi:succinyl-CoA synthetase beta subunit
MNVHEFQAKSLFAQFGVPVPRGKEITSPEAATAWADELNTPVFVVKAQIHAGGRGKAGGVKSRRTRRPSPAWRRNSSARPSSRIRPDRKAGKCTAC